MSDSQFKLQQILNLRKELERQRHIEFAEARQALDEAQSRLDREVARTEIVFREMLEKQDKGVDVSELLLYSSFHQKQKSTIKEQKLAIDVLDQEVEERRENLIDASKEKKVLEKFKEHKESEASAERASKEMKFIDELAVQKSGQK